MNDAYIATILVIICIFMIVVYFYILYLRSKINSLYSENNMLKDKVNIYKQLSKKQ